MLISEALAAAKDRILFGGWVQGYLHTDYRRGEWGVSDGVAEVPATFEQGIDGFCAQGAIVSVVKMMYPDMDLNLHTYPDGRFLPPAHHNVACQMRMQMEKVMRIVLVNHTQTDCSIAFYNDMMATEKEQILARFDEAIALAKEAEADGRPLA